MKNLIIVLVICLSSIVSYSQIDTINTNLILYGDFVDVDNVKCFFYKTDTAAKSWEYTHTTTYYKKYYIVLDTSYVSLIIFSNGEIQKDLCIDPLLPDKVKLDIDFSLNIGISKVLFYDKIECIYKISNVY